MRALMFAAVICITASSAWAQQGVPRSILEQQQNRPTLTVISEAPILRLPADTRSTLRVAAKGTRLVIVEDGADWILVQFNDPQFGLRQGYVSAKLVQRDALAPMDLSVPGAKPPAAQRVDQAAEQQRGQQPGPSIPPRVDTPGRQPMPRSGFWFNGGLGFGTLTCASCEGSYLGGFSGG